MDRRGEGDTRNTELLALVLLAVLTIIVFMVIRSIQKKAGG